MNSVAAADPATTIPSRRAGRAGLSVRRRRKGTQARLLLSRRDRVVLVLAICPALGWLAFAQGYPLGYSFWLSFQNWSLAESPTSQGFAGFSNFQEVLTDPVFRHSIVMTLLVMATVPLELAIGLALAYYAAGESHLVRALRTTLLLPMVIAPIAVGALWRLMLTPNSGLLDSTFGWLGLPQPNWLGEPHLAVIAVLAIDVWEWVPFSLIIYTAALSHIDPDLIGAAAVDGASRSQVMRHVTWPLLVPSTILISIFRFVDALLVIDIVYSLTGGGPGFATNTVALWVYNNGLRYFNLSEAAAASWLLLIADMIIALSLLWVRGRIQRSRQGA